VRRATFSGARVALSATWGAAALAFVPCALAQVTPIAARARVQVDAPPDCATASSFWGAIGRHTTQLVPGGDAGDATIDLTVRRGAEQVVGELRVTRGDEAPWQRSLKGATCDEVLDGLGLVTALAFDPSATVSPPRAAPTPPAPPAEQVAPEARDRPPASPSTRSAWVAAVGASGSAAGLGASEPSLVYGGFVELERDRAGVAPAFRLGVTHAESVVNVGAAGAALAWTFVDASVCPVRADLAPSLSFRPCLAVESGLVSASPRGLERGRDLQRAWFAAVLAARLRWSVGRVFFLGGELTMMLPILRDELAAAPSTTLYLVPPVVPGGGISLGLRFL
jgi:hypothetical protein